MSPAAKHEAGHAAALHIKGLVTVLRPGGCAVFGQHGIISLAASLPPTASDLSVLLERVAKAVPVNTSPVVEAAQERPELVPALLVFLLAGFGAEAEAWNDDFAGTIAVRTSSDFSTARQIIMDLVGDTGWVAQAFASEAVREALDRAAAWSKQPYVQTLINAASTYIFAHGAATWAELETIFSATAGNEPFDRGSAPEAAPGESPLIGVTPGTVAGCSAPRCG